jgi:hypothetical protein
MTDTAPDWRTALRDARDHLAQARDLAAATRAAQDAAFAALETALEGAFQEGVKALPEPTAPPSPHRRAHRPGKIAKLDADPELRAFVLARIDRLTFVEIAAEVAAHFPPARHIGKSGIHEWWHRNRKTIR